MWQILSEHSWQFLVRFLQACARAHLNLDRYPGVCLDHNMQFKLFGKLSEPRNYFRKGLQKETFKVKGYDW